MKIDSRLTFSKIRFDQDTDAHLILSLTAPAVNAEKTRPKLALVMCIDTSTSMGDNNKLEYAKQSILKMIDHLKGDDVFGVVAFDSDVHVVAKPVRLEGKKDEMRKAVSKLAVNGMTNFSGGMLKSLELLNNLDLGGDYLHRVIMFTDGVANVGPAKDKEGILRLLNANMGHVTVSAFGYGTGTQDFKPDFLAEFAREGKGNYAHVENPDKALAAFGTELGGLISTYASDISVEIKPLNGHSIESVITDVTVDEENTGEVFVKVPDLLAEETRHIVIAVKLSKQKVHGPRAVNVFDVTAKFQTFDSTGKRENHAEETKGKIQFVKEGDEDKKPDAKLDDIVGLAQLVRAQLEAEEQAKKGNFVQAQSVMRAATNSFTGRGREKLAAASASLGDRVGSASMYAQSAGYLRSFAGGATRGVGVASYSTGAEADLHHLGVVTSNSVQTSTSDSFTSALGGINVAGGIAANIGAAPQAWIGDVPPLVGGASFDIGGGNPILVAPVPEVHETNKKDEPKASSAKRLPLKQSKSKTRW